MNFKAVILACLTLITAQTALAAPPSESSVRELLALSGAGNIGVQMMNAIIGPLKDAIPGEPDDFWTEFMKEVNADDLVKLTIPIYQKYYSEEDIAAIIVFYKSPVGQRMLATMPAVIQDGMKVGENWGRKISERAFEKSKQKKTAPTQ